MKEKDLFAVPVALMLLLVLGAGCLGNDDDKDEYRYETTGKLMGSDVTITVYHESEEKAKQAAEAAFARMEEIAAASSRSDTSSELYQLNTAGRVDDPSPELRDMLEAAIYYWEVTDGVFDVTLLPLLDLWSSSGKAGPFHLFNMSQDRAEELDGATVSTELETAFQEAGYVLDGNASATVLEAGKEWTISSGDVNFGIVNTSGVLEVDTPLFRDVGSGEQGEYINQTLALMGVDRIIMAANSISIEDGMSITLDGMAKGYAADAALELLREQGVSGALVNVGGDMASFGTMGNDKKWEVVLGDPEGKKAPLTTLYVSGQAVAGSGSYERYFNASIRARAGLDPRTGSAEYRSSSAIVLAGNGTAADVLATTVYTLGPVEGIAFIETLPDAEALVVGYEDPSQVFRSAGM